MHSPCRTLTLGVALALGTALATDVANLAAQAPRPGATKPDGESRTRWQGGESDH